MQIDQKISVNLSSCQSSFNEYLWFNLFIDGRVFFRTETLLSSYR